MKFEVCTFRCFAFSLPGRLGAVINSIFRSIHTQLAFGCRCENNESVKAAQNFTHFEDRKRFKSSCVAASTLLKSTNYQKGEVRMVKKSPCEIFIFLVGISLFVFFAGFAIYIYVEFNQNHRVELEKTLMWVTIKWKSWTRRELMTHISSKILLLIFHCNSRQSSIAQHDGSRQDSPGTTVIWGEESRLDSKKWRLFLCGYSFSAFYTFYT